MIIDGKKIAESIISELKTRPRISKFFGAVAVGDDAVSLNFLKQKEKIAKELNIDFRLYHFPANIKTDELRKEISRLAGVKNCGGFTVQLPLPPGINQQYALNTIPKDKDVDILSETALGAFYSGRSNILPPAVSVVETIIKEDKLDVKNAHAVVIGSGFLIGKPVSFWLQNKVTALTVFDLQSQHLRAKLVEADLVVSGAGQANLFNSSELKNGALVVDFGYSYSGEKIMADFDPSGAEEKNIIYTPTPGGTGPILVAKLFENFYTLNSEK